jgi:hypothetical protein
LGCFVVRSVVIFDKVVRIVRVIQVLGVVSRVTWVINVFYGCNTYRLLRVRVIRITSFNFALLCLLGY